MDVVVTVPKAIWTPWIEEGDAVGAPPTGEAWGFSTWGVQPKIVPGERVYVVAHGRLRGYAPLVSVRFEPSALREGCGESKKPSLLGRVVFIRGAGAEAMTIREAIRGFRGWRQRWWNVGDEIPFPDWKTEGVA